MNSKYTKKSDRYSLRLYHTDKTGINKYVALSNYPMNDIPYLILRTVLCILSKYMCILSKHMKTLLIVFQYKYRLTKMKTSYILN